MPDTRLAFANHRKATGRYYDNEELKLFESLLAEIFDDISGTDDHMCAPENVPETRKRIAMAIIAAAEEGETSAARLKQAAMDRLF
ncbi:MAG TPA: hypothetical protein PKA33_13400 [Amaricoccus sp.]|uniref:hypothetical protein n=1 Tax=Amaricoccus sp. TaxID=1872485 RepID=UPI002B881168|nr:hypothetical protein [Amaricoccus sp.]HMQ93434.1 hypothetical protein [Amaricoccus sp.]HMR51070.1 hypothetical protein [Amaricoccus sp.]HMR59990.1 hypothetical protein [Amaricoccus sp.]HMU00347.1 hypothetical protein [Amaricoccus sp.]